MHTGGGAAPAQATATASRWREVLTSVEQVAGVDEAGRGPLAGAVVAAAVILAPGAQLPGLADSKKLSHRQRVAAALMIRERAVAWAVASATVEEIDSLNILQASLLAMRRAVDSLPLEPGFVLIDGNRCPAWSRASAAVVGGDALVPAISAASIIAKVERDAAMLELETQYPGYGFAQHKGYPTPMHLEALRRLGVCPEHRRSFAPVRAVIAQCGLEFR
jgi:ribonuclease HII